MTERKIQSLGRANKSKLRAFFNARFGLNLKNITQIKKKMGYHSIDESWEHLRNDYNDKIDQDKIELQQQALETHNYQIQTNELRPIWTDGVVDQIHNLTAGTTMTIDLIQMRRFYNVNQFMNIVIDSVVQFFGNTTDHIVIEVNGVYYTLNDNTIEKLRDFVNSNMTSVETELTSDGNILMEIIEATTMTITNRNKANKNKKADGAFFKYMNMTKYDFSKYGIFKKGEEQYEDNCLVYALKQANISEEKMEGMKIMVRNRKIALTDIEAICQKAQIQIQLKRPKEKDRKVYGRKYDEIYTIGLIEEHFFLIDQTDNTSFSIRNYNLLKDIDNANHAYCQKNGKFYFDKNETLDSFKIVLSLIENKDKCLEEISIDNSSIANSQFYKNVNKEIINLKYDDMINCKLVVELVKQSDEDKEDKSFKYDNVFFDFETYCDDFNIHIPYLCRTFDGIQHSRFVGEDCALKMLKSLKSNTRLIAHNAGYDYRFIVKHLTQNSEISRGTHLIGGSARFGKLAIKIKDSYNLISKPLMDFNEMFKFAGEEKEVMPYSLYTKENLNKQYINIDYVLNGVDKNGVRFIQDEDKDQFLNNIKRWNLQYKDTYNIIEYSSQYCKIDCEILYKGYNIFRDWIQECCDIDINDKLTIASLAHEYLINYGCYDGVYKLGGVPQMFIQSCVVGGRTMCSENKKAIYDNEERIKNDFDATSLYPSAMSRMDGFLLGKPKVITDLSYSTIQNYDGYFVEVMITDVGINRKFPLCSFKNDDGVRIFANDLIGKTFKMDKTSLEDLIKFQDVKFEIIRGYYFNEGHNKKIVECIKFLFNERLKKKKEENPIEEVYKLIMNSSYGYSIMKPIEYETKIFDSKEKFDIYFSRNYNTIHSYIQFDTKIKVKTIKPLCDHYNIAHIGVEILSMSKRIMNEVMCLAEDNNIEMFYQDTDSIHLYNDEIDKLSLLFKEKYGRVLIGKNMGQFHSDFKIKGAKNVIAKKSIFLGKKSYIDILEGDTDNGKVQDYHIRLKGIPNKVITYYCEKNKITAWDLFLQMYIGEAITFDLTNDGSKVNFVYNKDYTISTNGDFNRTLKFYTTEHSKRKKRKPSKVKKNRAILNLQG